VLPKRGQRRLRVFVATKKTLFFESNNSQKGGGGGGGGGFRVETRREKNLRWEIDDDVV
tara:strand:- start:55 stop:231 length:177 start_codon:yes stop_codon:yes gene_type:complete